MPTELQRTSGYHTFLTRSFDVLRRATSATSTGRPDVTWGRNAQGVDGRLVPLEASERIEMEQKFGAVTHRLLLKETTSIEFHDILRPASDATGPAYAVKGTYTYPGVRVAIVEETETDDASDYYP